MRTGTTKPSNARLWIFDKVRELDGGAWRDLGALFACFFFAGCVHGGCLPATVQTAFFEAPSSKGVAYLPTEGPILVLTNAWFCRTPASDLARNRAAVAGAVGCIAGGNVCRNAASRGSGAAHPPPSEEELRGHLPRNAR